MALLKAYRGKFPSVHLDAFVAENAVLIGDVTVAAHASIWYGCVLRGDVAAIHIGEGSNIQDNSVIHVASAGLNGKARDTVVGQNVTVGHQCILHACTLEDACFIGMQSCVMDDVLVQRGAMLGAGSLVSGGNVLESGMLYMGRPAKQRRSLNEAERAFIGESARFYSELAREHAG